MKAPRRANEKAIYRIVREQDERMRMDWSDFGDGAGVDNERRQVFPANDTRQIPAPGIGPTIADFMLLR